MINGEPRLHFSNIGIKAFPALGKEEQGEGRSVYLFFPFGVVQEPSRKDEH